MIVKATTAAQDAYIESLNRSHDPAPPPPIVRAPIAPTATLPRQAGREYVCPNCGAAVAPVENT